MSPAPTALVLDSQPSHNWLRLVGTGIPRAGDSCPLLLLETVGTQGAGPLSLVSVRALKRMRRHIPEASLLTIHSGSAVLLLLQTHRCATGRSSLLPGFSVAAQGVHASPKVTSSRHSDGCLSFLTEAKFAALQGGLAQETAQAKRCFAN